MATNGIKTIYDELRANIGREVRSVPVAGTSKEVTDRTWKSGFKVVFSNDGSSIQVKLQKGPKAELITKEVYKGPSATADNAEKAFRKAQKSVWDKLLYSLKKIGI